MKLRLLQALIIAFVLACGFTAGYSWPPQGRDQAIRDISNCTLADARAEKCFIPCSTDSDCMEKNGQTDH